jgi:hypothetical protein
MPKIPRITAAEAIRKSREVELKLRVNKVVQFASGGSHYTVYDADVEFITGRPGVQVIGTEPQDSLPGSYQDAANSIRRGAEHVLDPLGMGALIRIVRIVLHPVDFKPRKFEQFTTEELKPLVERWQAEQSIAPD